MMRLKISGKEYKVKFGFNSFCDSDILDDFMEMSEKLEKSAKTIEIKSIFIIIRELLFEGFKKNNPVENEQAVGDLLDLYLEQAPDGEKRGLLELFTAIQKELMEEGFLAGLFQENEGEGQAEQETQQAIPSQETTIQTVQTVQTITPTN